MSDFDLIEPICSQGEVQRFLRIYPGSLREHGYSKRFNGTPCREILNGEWFTSLYQTRTVIDTWPKLYNRVRPHQALGVRAPVSETLLQNGP